MRRKKSQYHEIENSCVIIPQDRAADFVELPGSYNRSIINNLSSNKYWEQLWIASICISVILHQTGEYRTDSQKRKQLSEFCKQSKLPPEVKKAIGEYLASKKTDEISDKRMTPSFILTFFLSMSIRNLDQFLKESSGPLSQIFSNYHIQTAVFIDSFDQAIEKNFPNDFKMWVAAQNGLASAAWEVRRLNPHTSVFVTIRKEAYACFRDGRLANMRGAALELGYSKQDLRKIFLSAIKSFEGLDSIEEFVGFSKVKNVFLDLEEDVFDYILRHSLYAPRNLIMFGQQISNLRTPPKTVIRSEAERMEMIESVCRVVNEEASAIAKIYLDNDLKPIFENIEMPSDLVNDIMKNCNTTVLEFDNIVRLKEKFEIESDYEFEHPFCMLYNVGLLGVVQHNLANGRHAQKFKEPSEFDWNYECALDRFRGNKFLVHPALHFIAQESATPFAFAKVRIGNQLPWGQAEEEAIEELKLGIFVSYAHDDWERSAKKVFEVIDTELGKMGVFGKAWIDRRDIEFGENYIEAIDSALDKNGYIILLISNNFIERFAAMEEFRARIATDMRQNRRTIFPVLIDGVKRDNIPLFARTIQCPRVNIENNNNIDPEPIKAVLNRIKFRHIEDITKMRASEA